MAYIPKERTVTIANGQTVSDAVELNQATVLGIHTPAALTGTELTFQGSSDGSDYDAIYDASGIPVSCFAAADRNIPTNPNDFLAWRFIKVVSNAAEGGARVIGLVTRILR